MKKYSYTSYGFDGCKKIILFEIDDITYFAFYKDSDYMKVKVRKALLNSEYGMFSPFIEDGEAAKGTRIISYYDCEREIFIRQDISKEISGVYTTVSLLEPPEYRLFLSDFFLIYIIENGRIFEFESDDDAEKWFETAVLLREITFKE